MRISVLLQGFAVCLVGVVLVIGVLAGPALAGGDHDHDHHQDWEVLARAFVIDSAGDRILYFDAPDHLLAGDFELAAPRGAAVTPDGRFLVITHRDHDTTTIASTGLLLEWHDDHWDRVAVAPRIHRQFVAGARPAHIRALFDGRVAVANDGDDTVSIVDPHTGLVVKVPAGAGHASLAVYPDPATLFASDIEYGLVDIIDLETWKHEATIRIGARPHGAAYSETLGTVYFAAADGIWEISAQGETRGQVLQQLVISQEPDARTGYIEARRHGEWLYGTIGETEQLFALDLRTGDATHVSLAGRPRAFAFDPRERWVAVALHDRPVVQIIGTAAGEAGYHQVKKTIDLGEVVSADGLRRIAVTPDGEYIYVTGGEHVVVLDDHGHVVQDVHTGGAPATIYLAHREPPGDDHDHDHDH